MYVKDSVSDDGFGILPLIPLAILTAGGVAATIGATYAYTKGSQPEPGAIPQPTLTGEIGEGAKWAMIMLAGFLGYSLLTQRK